MNEDILIKKILQRLFLNLSIVTIFVGFLFYIWALYLDHI